MCSFDTGAYPKFFTGVGGWGVADPEAKYNLFYVKNYVIKVLW
jgi:hypothetical protein